METYRSPFLLDKEKNEEPESTMSLLKKHGGGDRRKNTKKNQKQGGKKGKKREKIPTTKMGPVASGSDTLIARTQSPCRSEITP